MRPVFTLAATAMVAVAFASGAFAAEFTKGTVKKVDAKAKKVTSSTRNSSLCKCLP